CPAVSLILTHAEAAAALLTHSVAGVSLWTSGFWFAVNLLAPGLVSSPLPSFGHWSPLRLASVI
ncbi:hypothetical protein S245_013251, partial [Arachis hypogaea]